MACLDVTARMLIWMLVCGCRGVWCLRNAAPASEAMVRAVFSRIVAHIVYRSVSFRNALIFAQYSIAYACWSKVVDEW